MRFYLLRQHLLAALAHCQQIHHEDTLVLLQDLAHVLEVSLVSELETPVNFGLCVEAHLLEKDWQAPSDLEVAEGVLVDFDYLLRLAVVGHESLVVDPSIEVAGSPLLVRPPRDEHIPNLDALVKDLEAADEALDDRRLPIAANLVLIQFLE